jgi:hypothetical protein
VPVSTSSSHHHTDIFPGDLVDITDSIYSFSNAIVDCDDRIVRYLGYATKKPKIFSNFGILISFPLEGAGIHVSYVLSPAEMSWRCTASIKPIQEPEKDDSFP